MVSHVVLSDAPLDAQGVLRAAAEAQGGLPNEKTALVVLGDKGATALGDRGRTFTFFPGVDREKLYEQSVEIKDYLVKEVLARRMGK